MNSLLFVSVLLGIFLIVVRGPFAFAPEVVTEFYRKQLFEKPIRLRLLGAFFGILGCSMLFSASGVAGTGAQLVRVFGFLLLFPGLFVGLAPRIAKEVIYGFLDVFGPPGLRFIGILNIVLGLVWIYFSFRFFG
jgi:uncharacterized protein YjeT (DUF2065 family)